MALELGPGLRAEGGETGWPWSWGLGSGAEGEDSGWPWGHSLRLGQPL